MEITSSKVNNYFEIKLNGRLDSNTSLRLEKDIVSIIENGEENILVNFKDLQYISSSGLRVFLVAAKMLEEKGKKINLCNMRDYVREVFDIAGFSAIFNIYDTKQDTT